MNLLYILLLVLWSAFNSGSTSSFLIYNKDHNKCVYTVSATVVLTAPCDTSSTAQRFRWISSSRIISLSFSLCLGAEKIKNWVKIILQPCNVSNPGQTWECKDETLFGLKGYPLHLNYGNYDEPNMMLFNGTGVWSRWLIYGTEENLCSHGYQDSSDAWRATATTPVTGASSNGMWDIGTSMGHHTLRVDRTIDGSDSPDVWPTTANTDGSSNDYVPVPNITVYRQMEDREHDSVIVLCMFDMERYMFYWRSFTLSVESEENYTVKRITHSRHSEICAFLVTVSPPATFTCETAVYYEGESKNLRSQTYTYEWSVLDHHEEGVSLFYICFSSSIAVGLVIMTVAVIVTTIRSK